MSEGQPKNIKHSEGGVGKRVIVVAAASIFTAAFVGGIIYATLSLMISARKTNINQLENQVNNLNGKLKKLSE